MATFVASAAVDMNTIAQDLKHLGPGFSTWTNTVNKFTVSSNGHPKIEGSGGPFLPFGQPTSGNLDSLTVTYEYPTEQLAYTLSDLGTTFEGLLFNITHIGATFALMSLLNGDDTITGSDHADHLLGFAGRDTLHGGDRDDHLDGGSGDDHLFGDAGRDSLAGGDGDDHLNGGADNDGLIGGAGKDALDGGAGNDSAMYDSLYTTVVAKLAGAAAANVVIGGHLEDTVRNVENIHGGHADDKLTGDGLNNGLFGNGGRDTLTGAGGGDRLNGGDGKDALAGGAGADRLNGGEGNDTLVGGKGHDTFIFDSALKNNVDIIKDFSPADEIRLSHHIFSALGIGSHDFFAVGAAHHAGDHIIYHASTGDLLYDADGNGAGAAVKFAHLAGHPGLTGADFLVTA